MKAGMVERIVRELREMVEEALREVREAQTVEELEKVRVRWLGSRRKRNEI